MDIIDQKFFKHEKNKTIHCIDIIELNKLTWRESINEDWVEISKDEAILLASPPPTKEELIWQFEQKRQFLINEATQVIDPMRDAKAGGYIEDEDIPRLQAWQKYRYQLTKVDTSTAPDVEFPVKPE